MTRKSPFSTVLLACVLFIGLLLTSCRYAPLTHEGAVKFLTKEILHYFFVRQWHGADDMIDLENFQITLTDKERESTTSEKELPKGERSLKAFLGLLGHHSSTNATLDFTVTKAQKYSKSKIEEHVTIYIDNDPDKANDPKHKVEKCTVIMTFERKGRMDWKLTALKQTSDFEEVKKPKAKARKRYQRTKPQPPPAKPAKKTIKRPAPAADKPAA